MAVTMATERWPNTEVFLRYQVYQGDPKRCYRQSSLSLCVSLTMKSKSRGGLRSPSNRYSNNPGLNNSPLPGMPIYIFGMCRGVGGEGDGSICGCFFILAV